MIKRWIVSPPMWGATITKANMGVQLGSQLESIVFAFPCQIIWGERIAMLLELLLVLSKLFLNVTRKFYKNNNCCIFKKKIKKNKFCKIEI